IIYVVYRIAIAIMPITSLAVGSELVWLAYLAPYTRIFEFTAGCVAASVFMSFRSSPPLPRERTYIAFAQTAGLVLIVGYIVAIGQRYILNFEMRSFTDYLLEGYFLGPVIAFLIFSICRYDGVPSKILSLRAAVAGGT